MSVAADPVTFYRQPHLPDDTPCAICLDTVEESDDGATWHGHRVEIIGEMGGSKLADKGHYFHTNCISEAFRHVHTAQCPQCRVNVFGMSEEEDPTPPPSPTEPTDPPVAGEKPPQPPSTPPRLDPTRVNILGCCSIKYNTLTTILAIALAALMSIFVLFILV